MIGAVVGLLTLLCALVTGLLVWTAYGVYAGQNMAIQTVASKALQLDLALADYGPDAVAERASLRDRLGKTIDQVWRTRGDSDANFAAKSFASAIQIMRDPEKAIGILQPSTDQQREALATAKADIAAIGQSRLQMSFTLTAPICYPLLLTVLAWVLCLFLGFGLMSRGSVMSVVALAVGATSVASAVLLILDLSNPYSGMLRASAAPLEQVLAIMGRE